MKSKLLLRLTALAGLAIFSLTATAQTEIQQLANKWAQAYNTSDSVALGALYTNNAHLYVHGSPMLIGRQSIQEFWKDDMGIQNPMTLLTVTNSVEGYDMMLVHGNYQVVGRDTGEVLGSGRFAHIWHKVGNDWKLDQDLWNQPFE